MNKLRIIHSELRNGKDRTPWMFLCEDVAIALAPASPIPTQQNNFRVCGCVSIALVCVDKSLFLLDSVRKRQFLVDICGCQDSWLIVVATRRERDGGH